MCLIDYRLSRWVRTVYREIPVPPGSHVTIPASKQRVGIEFSSHDTAGSLCVAIDTPASAHSILIGYNSTDHKKWNFSIDGDTPQRMFSCFNPTGTASTLVVIERLLPEKILEEELNRIAGI